MAKGLRAVLQSLQSPKHLVQPEKSDDEEEPTQNSSVAHEEDDDADDAEGDDELEEDEESKDQRGVGAAERPTGGPDAGQGNGDNGGRSGRSRGNKPPNNPPNDAPTNPPNNPPNNNNGRGGGGPATNAGGMLQPGYLPNGTRYSIPFYNILISIGLMTANVKRIFQEDIRSADDFATYINQEALERMLEKDDYGLNNLTMVKQQKLQAFHKWLCKQKAQDFDLNDVNILSSFNANAMATILAKERKNGMMREHDNFNKGTKDLGMTLPLFKSDQRDWKSWNKKV